MTNGVPAGRLGTHVHEAADDDGGQHGRAHHQAPVEARDARRVGHVVEGNVGDVAEHDAESGPHLGASVSIWAKLDVDGPATA
jgi:hypothetical protein